VGNAAETAAGPPLITLLTIPPFAIRALGRTDYAATWRAMQAYTAARAPDTPDAIWLTEHAPIYTLGLAGRREHLLRDNGIPVVKVDRGGQVTYHGPGQLVLYVLFDLRRTRIGVRDMVRRLEIAVVHWLESVGISAYGKASAPGVYVRRANGEAKIAALGLKVRNGCTYHGLAVNVAMDLAPFADIDPCGYPGLAVTQLADFGVTRTVEAAGHELAPIVAGLLAERAIAARADDAAG
jgi:lipoyl(octanoyl) transferase